MTWGGAVSHVVQNIAQGSELFDLLINLVSAFPDLVSRDLQLALL